MGGSNLSLIAMNQDGVVAAIEYDLEGPLNAFGGNLDTRIFVSGKRDLEMLDTILFEEPDIVLGIIMANQGTSLTSACPTTISHGLDQQDSVEAKCSKMLKVTCARKTAAINAWGNSIEIRGWANGRRWWSTLLYHYQFG